MKLLSPHNTTCISNNYDHKNCKLQILKFKHCYRVKRGFIA